jgi:hypothetical protein
MAALSKSLAAAIAYCIRLLGGAENALHEHSFVVSSNVVIILKLTSTNRIKAD